MKKEFVTVEFTGKGVKVDYDVSEREKLMVALTVLEGIVCKEMMVDSETLREIIDEDKMAKEYIAKDAKND